MYTGYHILLFSLLMLQVLAKPLRIRRGPPETACHSSQKENEDSQVLGRIYRGKATTWNASWSSGNCLFEKWPQPRGLGAIAVSSNLWNSAEICGACISVTGPYGTHNGIISDQCPSCDHDGLDLSSELWKEVGNGQNPGILPITWQIVPCNFSTPMVFINKDGVSKDWNSIQVAGAEVPIRSLEVKPITNTSSDIVDKTWIKLTKQSNSNYFQPEFGKALGTLANLKVTCDNGKQIVTQNVRLDQPLNTTLAAGNC